MKKQKESQDYIAYVTIFNITFCVGEYVAKEKESVMDWAMRDLATIMGLRVFPSAVNEHRPFLAAASDMIKYYASKEHRDIEPEQKTIEGE